MADKSALNVDHELFANNVFTCGFFESTGNYVELVNGVAIGVPQGTSQSRGTDGTYGTFWSGESDDSLVNFGDLVDVDGNAEFGLHILARNDASEIPGGPADNQTLASKGGSGEDSFFYTWLNSENLIGQVDIGASPYPSITDGLTDTDVHHFGLDYDGTTVTISIDGTTGTQSQTGTVNATAHPVRIGNSDTETNGWLGDFFAVCIFDVGLDSSQRADLDPSGFIDQIFAADGVSGSFDETNLDDTLSSNAVVGQVITSSLEYNNLDDTIEAASQVSVLASLDFSLSNDSILASALISSFYISVVGRGPGMRLAGKGGGIVG